MLGTQRKLLKRNALSISIGMALAITSVQSLADCGTVVNATTQINCSTTATPNVDASLVVNGGNITSTNTAISVGANSDSGKATLTANDLTINNTASVHGMSASGNIAEVNLSGNNSITLASTADTAVLVSSKNGSSMTIDGVLNINNKSTSGVVNERDGIELNVWGTGSGNATLNHNGTGEIKTVNGNAIYLQAHGSSGDAIANLLGGEALKLTTSGNNHYGISATTTKAASTNNTNGNVIINSNATINTNGKEAHGIFAETIDGTINIENSGTVTTGGISSSGIHAQSQTGGISIKNSGNIALNDASTTATGNTSGIFVRQMGAGAAGDVYIENSANISASSNNNAAIRVIVENGITSGDITIKHLAGLLDVTGYNSDGIVVNTKGAHSGLINVLLQGDITTGGPTGVEGNHGVYIIHSNAASSGDIQVINEGKISIIDNPRSHGIEVINNGSGKATIINRGESSTMGSSAYAIKGNVNSGLLSIGNTGSLKTSGVDAFGIYANSASSGDINIINSGQIVTQGRGSHAIKVLANTGNTLIENSGDISTSGLQGYGINVSTTAGDITLINSGSITTRNDDVAATLSQRSDGILLTADVGDITVLNTGIINSIGHGIHTITANGNVNITASNNITAMGDSPDIHGIYSNLDYSGSAVVTYGNGTIKTNGSGITIWDMDMGSADVNGTINLNSGGIIDATKGTDGLVLSFKGIGEMNIAQGASVHGGATSGLRLKSALATSRQTVNNWGTVDSTVDRAISNEGVAGSQVTINNYGTLTGFAEFGAGNTTINNNAGGVWELRNFADTDGDGIRDTKGVAVMDFGAGSDTFLNEAGATLRLSPVSGAADNEPAGEYLTIGVQSSFYEGVVHGQLINLNRFENRGTIDLSANGQAGDLLIITGNNMSGSYGGGTFVSDGGTLLLDTHLNNGHFDSLSDMLMVDDVTVGANGPTKIIINRVSGNGELTEGNGIKVVKVLGSADANSFELGNVVKGGIYEYTLHQGELDGVSPASGGEQHWYLRNRADQLNPDLGTYLSNQTAATGLFIHSLHDRLGEPQYAERYSRDGSQPSMWVRALTTNTKNEAGGGLLGQNTTGSLVHMGGDIAQWTSSGDSRYHLGLMAAYGESETTSRSHTTGSRSKGKIDGYGAGAYFTWYSNESMPEGSYVDLWSMYNWFDNEVEGAAKYDSNAWISSLEIGHAVTAWQGERMQVMVEPHGQIAYTTYRADEHSDSNGLKVTDEDADGFYTRLGARTYLRDSLNSKKAQPFIEANWLHSTAKNSLRFNGIEMADNTPKDRLEVKVGVQGEITKNLQVYSHIGLQWGKDDYSKSEGMLGLKYRF